MLYYVLVRYPQNATLIRAALIKCMNKADRWNRAGVVDEHL